MSRVFSIVSACALSAVLACPALAESNWKLPSLNPFSKKSATTSPARTSSRFKMPNLLPTWGAKKSRPSAQPSTWTKFTSGTKAFWGKTKDTLTFWDTSSGKKPAHSTFSRPQRKEEKKSMFASWLSGNEEPKRPRSVSEFLKQPRPTP